MEGTKAGTKTGLFSCVANETVMKPADRGASNEPVFNTGTSSWNLWHKYTTTVNRNRLKNYSLQMNRNDSGRISRLTLGRPVKASAMNLTLRL